LHVGTPLCLVQPSIDMSVTGGVEVRQVIFAAKENL
jgi:hypothetical protein